MADPQDSVDSYRIYIAVPNGVWETVPYRDGLVIENLTSRISLGTTRIYVKSISGEYESEPKMRTLYRQAISLTMAGSARVTESISWW